MAYNYVEPAYYKAKDAVGQKVQDFSSAINSAVNKVQADSEAQRPNYNLLASANPAGTPPRNAPNMPNMPAVPEATTIPVRSALDTANSRIASASAGFLPTFRGAWNDMASETQYQYDKNGLPAALGQTVRSGLALFPAFGRDVVDTVSAITQPPAQALEQAVTGEISENPLTLGDISNRVRSGYTASQNNQQPYVLKDLPGVDETGRRTLRGFAVEGQPGDAAYALQQGALANAIRQQTIDADIARQAAGAAKIDRAVADSEQGSALDGLMRQQQSLIRDLQSGVGSTTDRNATYRALQALQSMAGDEVSRANTQDVTGARLQGDLLRSDAVRESSLLNAQNESARIASQNARDAAYIADLQRKGREGSLGLKDIVSSLDANGRMIDLETGNISPDFYRVLATLAPSLNQADQQAAYKLLSNDIGMAQGGLVPAPVGQSAIGGSMGSATPDLPDPAVIAKYQQYANASREMGLPAVSFLEFSRMEQPTMGFADGGPVPEVGGKMVVDTDPNAPTDSIPAEIDGQQPAALNSGEFVIPSDVVLFFGTDKLQKMIKQARENANGAGQSAIGSATA